MRKNKVNYKEKCFTVSERQGGREKVYEHDFLMCGIIGRDLYPEEVVHHINENKLDNRLENLMLLKTRADHNHLHKCLKLGITPKLTLTETGAYECEKLVKKCVVCGKECQGIRFSVCRSCYLKNGYQLTIKGIPSYLKLIEEYEAGTSYLQLAEKYNTSYQTIRARIRKKI